MLEAKLEIAGLALVLGATFWRVFLAAPVREIAEEGKRIHVEEKLDSLWRVVSYMYMKVFPGDAKRAASPPDLVEMKWDFAGPIDSLAQRQTNCLQYVQDAVFIVGSLLLIGSHVPAAFAAAPDPSKQLSSSIAEVKTQTEAIEDALSSLSTSLDEIRLQLGSAEEAPSKGDPGP